MMWNNEKTNIHDLEKNVILYTLTILYIILEGEEESLIGLAVAALRLRTHRLLMAKN